MFFLAYLLCCFCIEKTWTVLIESSADRGNAKNHIGSNMHSTDMDKTF